MTPEAFRDALLEAVRRREPETVRDLIAAADEKLRRTAAPAVTAQYEGLLQTMFGSGSRGERLAAILAVVGTSTARQLSGNRWAWRWGLDDRHADDLVYDVLAARGRRFVETLARMILGTDGAVLWPLVRRAVREGLIDRPADDAYTTAMVNGVNRILDAGQLEPTYDALVADQGLLDHEIWRIFEVDTGAELAGARDVTWVDGRPVVLADNSWIDALTRLAGEGRLDRHRLLDVSLDALQRDFRATTVGWYARLHEALEPSVAERTQRIPRYLALLAEPAPAAVKEGLAGLRPVAGAVPAGELAGAIRPAVSQRQKGVVTGALGLLAAVAKRDEVARPALLEAAAGALGHERVDVQERALTLVERYPGAAPRATLLGYVDSVSATLRPRLDALTGLATTEPPAAGPVAPVDWPDPVVPVLTVDLLRRTRPPFEPVASVDDLVELGTMLLEDRGTGDDAERFLDGVSRLCDRRPSGFERRTAALLDTASRAARPLGTSGTDAIALLIRAWVGRERPPRGLGGVPRTGLGFLGQRTLEIAAEAARGRSRELLATPSHTGGWIDPDVLRQRLPGRRFRNRPGPADHRQAQLRAFPHLAGIVFDRTVEPPTHVENQSVVFTARDPDAVPEVADGLRYTGIARGNFPHLYPGWGAVDALGTRWCATVLPSLPEVSFAAAAGWTTGHIESGTIWLHPEAILELALDPELPLGETAWLAVAAGLLARAPDQRRIATDVIVASIADGRFDPDALGTELGWLLERGFGTVSRAGPPLRDAGRVSPLHAAQVVRAAGRLAVHCDPAPRGFHVPLEAALECGAEAGYAIEDGAARAALERIAAASSGASRMSRSARALLALEARPAAAEALRREAAAAADR